MNAEQSSDRTLSQAQRSRNLQNKNQILDNWKFRHIIKQGLRSKSMDLLRRRLQLYQLYHGSASRRPTRRDLSDRVPQKSNRAIHLVNALSFHIRRRVRQSDVFRSTNIITLFESYTDVHANKCLRCTPGQQFHTAPEHPDEYGPKLDLPTNNVRRSSYSGPMVTPSTEDLQGRLSSQRGRSGSRNRPPRRYSDVSKQQDIQEVWFAGNHADIGGGWEKMEGEKWALSHVPLVW
jgi:Uncharacterized alpha/beta hydrolase domain (DUF2235)